MKKSKNRIWYLFLIFLSSTLEQNRTSAFTCWNRNKFNPSVSSQFTTYLQFSLFLDPIFQLRSNPFKFTTIHLHLYLSKKTIIHIAGRTNVLLRRKSKLMTARVLGMLKKIERRIFPVNSTARMWHARSLSPGNRGDAPFCDVNRTRCTSIFRPLPLVRTALEYIYADHARLARWIYRIADRLLSLSPPFTPWNRGQELVTSSLSFPSNAVLRNFRSSGRKWNVSATLGKREKKKIFQMLFRIADAMQFK